MPDLCYESQSAFAEAASYSIWGAASFFISALARRIVADIPIMSKSENPRPLLSVVEAAAYLNVSQSTVRRIAISLGAVRVAGQIRIRPESVEKYLDSRDLRDTARSE